MYVSVTRRTSSMQKLKSIWGVYTRRGGVRVVVHASILLTAASMMFTIPKRIMVQLVPRKTQRPLDRLRLQPGYLRAPRTHPFSHSSTPSTRSPPSSLPQHHNQRPHPTKPPWSSTVSPSVALRPCPSRSSRQASSSTASSGCGPCRGGGARRS